MVIKKSELEEKLKTCNLREVAKFYGLNYTTLWRKCKKHNIKIRRNVGKKVFIIDDGGNDEKVQENKN